MKNIIFIICFCALFICSWCSITNKNLTLDWSYTTSECIALWGKAMSPFGNSTWLVLPTSGDITQQCILSWDCVLSAYSCPKNLKNIGTLSDAGIEWGICCKEKTPL